MLDLKNAGLTELLHDFYTLTGLKLCIFDTDFKECASTPIKLVSLLRKNAGKSENLSSRCHELRRRPYADLPPHAESPCSTDVTRG